MSGTSSGPGRVTVDLSVVVVRFAGGEYVKRALSALATQHGFDAYEVIVAHHSRDVPDSATRDAFPLVRWVSADSTDPAALRAAAVRAATGTIIACTEDHCVPDPDWCRRVVTAHQRSSASVIGGAIDKVTPDSAESWAVWLMDYSRYMPPLAPGPAVSCSDCNVSYKRDPLEREEHVWREVFRETEVHAAVTKNGERREVMLLDPSIVVLQGRTSDMTALARERFEHGRVYGAQIASGRTVIDRLGRAIVVPLAPLITLLRARRRMRAAGRAGEAPRRAWVLLPRLAFYWTMGEVLGLVTGSPGRSPDR
ncbi:MAG: glycosyltransferase [Gemmatimonadota bacterium]